MKLVLTTDFGGVGYPREDCTGVLEWYLPVLVVPDDYADSELGGEVLIEGNSHSVLHLEWANPECTFIIDPDLQQRLLRSAPIGGLSDPSQVRLFTGMSPLIWSKTGYGWTGNSTRILANRGNVAIFVASKANGYGYGTWGHVCGPFTPNRVPVEICGSDAYGGGASFTADYVRSVVRKPDRYTRWSNETAFSTDAYVPPQPTLWNRPIGMAGPECEVFDYFNCLGSVGNPEISVGFASAYADAIENLPQAACNSIANLLEITDSLASLKAGRMDSILTSLSDVGDDWLKYRYCYNTSKADLAEYATLTSRLGALAKTDKFRCFGQYRRNKKTFRCGFDLATQSVIPHDQLDWLMNYGFKLSPQNVWDMIPYSFIVDWFTHIGDILNTLENYATGLEAEPSNIWYSVTSAYPEHGGVAYLRIPGTGVRHVLPSLHQNTTSSRVFFMRAADTLALFGR